MIIITKNNSHIINFDYVTEIFKGSDTTSIKINFDNGGRYELERYQCEKDVDIALELLGKAFGNAEVFHMPG